MSIRIVLVDDHKLFLDGLRALLEKEKDMEVVGEGEDGKEALRLAHEKTPDLVVLDVAMPGMNGIECAKRISTELPRTRVLCLSMHSDQKLVTALLEAGASGYLLKDCAREEFVKAIRTVMGNQAYLSPAVATRVVDVFRNKVTPDPSRPSELLTAREREVLQLIAEGSTTKEIAARLHVSQKTVDTHREHIMDKLSIHNIAGLTKYALRYGITGSE